MILLGKPYVSPLLAKTLADLRIPAVKVGDVHVPDEETLNWHSAESALAAYLEHGGPLLTNSENAIDILETHLQDGHLIQLISMCKNKSKFRDRLKQMYPQFFYREYNLQTLREESPDALPYPLIVKPSVGYASLGVYRVTGPEEWVNACENIQLDMEEAGKLYPQSVLDTGRFLVEEWIEGEEYAVDAYFTEQGEPVILNVFKRMFAHAGDTSDRIYYTSKQVVREALQPVQDFLQKLGQTDDFCLFPLHVEVRISAQGKLVPIEINPLRFAGIGTADLGAYAYGHNVYELYFRQQQPDWERFLNGSDEHVYSFFCAELPVSLNMNRIETIREAEFCQKFSHIVEYRPMNKYDPTTFAVVFYRSDNLDENQRLLQLDLQQFVLMKELIHT